MIAAYHVVYIGLGSNLQDPITQVRTALKELTMLPKTTLLARSSLYRTRPLGGPVAQPNYINAVAKLQTQLGPMVLLHMLQAIEHKHQRVRECHWGPRTLDLDMLTYDNVTIQTEHLTLPHPEMHKRDFVLIPKQEIDNGEVPCAHIQDLTSLAYNEIS